MTLRVPLLLSVLAGLTCLAAPSDFAGHVVVKGSAVGCLAVLAWPQSRLLAAGLAFSSLGDVLLDMGEQHFVPGLAAFLVTHLLYTTLFVNLRARPGKPNAARVTFAGGVVVYGVLFTVLLAPHLGTMMVPVILYIAAITAMVVCSSLPAWATALVPAGALLFLVSDSILGWNRFVGPAAGRGFLVWSTYYGGQLAIALGVLRHR